MREKLRHCADDKDDKQQDPRGEPEARQELHIEVKIPRKQINYDSGQEDSKRQASIRQKSTRRTKSGKKCD